MKKKQVNIVMSEEVHRKAKVVAILKGMTLNEFMKKAIEEAVEKEKTRLRAARWWHKLIPFTVVIIRRKT